MIKVICGNNMGRSEKIVSADTTIASHLKACGISYEKGITSLNGTPLTPGDFDKTFADFGITSQAYLLNVVKADNA